MGFMDIAFPQQQNQQQFPLPKAPGHGFSSCWALSSYNSSPEQNFVIVSITG